MFDHVTAEKRNFIVLSLSYVASVLVMFFVRYTGGTTYVYANLMYVPISIASYAGGKKYGVFHAVFSGLLLGPFMLLDASNHIMQKPINWVLRILIYAAMALIIGGLSDHDRKRMKHEATYDKLTGFKKPTVLVEALENNHKASLIMLTINNYRPIFNTFGYDFSSRYIKEFSRTLNKQLQKCKNVEVYRMIGSTFIIKILDTENTHDCSLKDIMQRLMIIHKSVIQVNGVPVYTELKFGVSKHDASLSPEARIKQTSLALNYAQDADLDYYLFESFLDTKYSEQAYILSHFKSAIKNRELKLASQNIYDIDGKKMHAREFLVRWESSDGKSISPATFVPLIEKTDLIHDLTKFVIDEVVGYVSYMHPSEKNIIASINFSSKDFNHSNIEYLVERITESGIDAKTIQVEITEESLVLNQSMLNEIERLKSSGVRIVIDDFGIGYSSYDLLGNLPIDGIKIDQSLIRNIDKNPRHKMLCKCLVDFCKPFNIDTVAEGVETESIAEACRDIGIDYLQGYLLSRPQLLDESYKKHVQSSVPSRQEPLLS